MAGTIERPTPSPIRRHGVCAAAIMSRDVFRRLVVGLEQARISNTFHRCYELHTLPWNPLRITSVPSANFSCKEKPRAASRSCSSYVCAAIFV